jgi:hypothetical protein
MTRALSAAGCLAAAAALGAGAVISATSDEARITAAAFGGAGLLVLAFAVAIGWGRVVVWAVAALGASYAASLAGRSLDLGAAAAGAALFLVAELAAWSISSRRGGGVEQAVTLQRAGALGAAALGAAAVGVLILGVSVVPARGGYAVEVLGAAAAAGVVLVAALALRGRSR